MSTSLTPSPVLPPPPSYPPSTPHLNQHNLLILSHQSRGRGVYASRPMLAGTLIDISPVLIFPREEWLAHGQKTLLDSYTFKWGGMGDMALALGLGSLFNHSSVPSVSFSLDKESHSIRYTLVRDVAAGEELCISYGPWGKQYEDVEVDSDTDDEERQRRDLEAFLKIGEDRSDSEVDGTEYDIEDDEEVDDDDSGSVQAGSSLRTHPKSARNKTSPCARIVRRSRTRYTNGVVKLPASSSSAGSDSGADASRPSTSVRRSVPVAAGLPGSPRFKSRNSVSPQTPIWRMTSLPDPSTVPLELRACHAIIIPPRVSSQIMGFLRRHSRQLGRGRTIGSEEDPLRHAKTLTKKEGDGGRLRALLCPYDVLGEDDLRSLITEVGLPLDEIELIHQQVASTPAPIKERATEWSAAWPVALRTMAVPTSSSGGPGTPVAGNSSALTQSPSAIAASVIGSSSPRPAAFVDRKADNTYWSSARTAWVVKKLARCVLTAEEASRRGEVPVGVHVCPSILSTTTPIVSLGSSQSDSVQAPSSSSPLAPPPSLFGGWDADGIPLDGGEAIEVDAFDTRISNRNPIKHAVGNAISKVAEIRAYKRALAANTTANAGDRDRASSPVTPSSQAPIASQTSVVPSSIPRPSSPASSGPMADDPSARPPSPPDTSTSGTSATLTTSSLATLLNGQDYLLTSLTLFTTHEPCVYCCMSLVHSRVRNVVFLEASPGSGGCCGSRLPKGKRCDEGIDVDEGGPYALQEQRGLNHRYDVWKWRGGLEAIRAEVDAQRARKHSQDSSAPAPADVEALVDLSHWGRLDP
ncbi:unnamed protein product [Parajaminaea phylloscopi]